MFPIYPMHNCMNRARTDTKTSCQFLSRNTIGGLGADCSYCFSAKLDVCAGFSGQVAPSAFSYSISYIVSLSSGKKVLGVIASRIITAMANLHSAWNLAVSNHVTKAMRSDIFAIKVNGAVSAF